MKLSVNYWAVLVCAIVNMLIGMFWYSPMAFGDVWAKAGSFPIDQLAPTPWHFLGAAIVSLVIAWALAQVLVRAEVKGIGEGIVLGLIIWFGFIATTHFSSVIWAGKPFPIFLIDTGCLLAYMVVDSSILSLWRK